MTNGYNGSILGAFLIAVDPTAHFAGGNWQSQLLVIQAMKQIIPRKPTQGLVPAPVCWAPGSVNRFSGNWPRGGVGRSEVGLDGGVRKRPGVKLWGYVNLIQAVARARMKHPSCDPTPVGENTCLWKTEAPYPRVFCSCDQVGMPKQTVCAHSHRLRYMVKQLENGEVNIEELKKNLEYTASLLEAVYIDETR